MGAWKTSDFCPRLEVWQRGKSKKEENNKILQEINSFFESGATCIPIQRPATLGRSVAIFFSGLILNVYTYFLAAPPLTLAEIF
jgi:hypothetical protein